MELPLKSSLQSRLGSKGGGVSVGPRRSTYEYNPLRKKNQW